MKDNAAIPAISLGANPSSLMTQPIIPSIFMGKLLPTAALNNVVIASYISPFSPHTPFSTATSLKAMARGLLPDSVIDRPKGYFPMPALKYVRGDFFHFMQDILHSQACRERGIYDRAYVDLLLSAPEMHHTRLQGSKLWHLALLELWLQLNVD
jgi:hypothetical protein